MVDRESDRAAQAVVIALMLIGWDGFALAQTAPAPPPAAALPADLQACLQETGDFVRRGKAVIYVIAITNTCGKTLRCEVSANVSGAKGSSLGHTIMTLGPAGSATAKKTYDMRVKAAGGIVQVSRDCKAL